MPAYSDRQETLRWAKIGPPGGLPLEAPRTASRLWSGATSPACETLLAGKLPRAITVCKYGRIRV